MKEDFVLTTCPFCGTGCNFYLQVLDDQLVGLIPSKGHPVNQGELCVLGRSAHQFVQHPDRLTRPLIRKNGELVEADWSEAYQMIAKGFQKIRDEDGGQALGVLSSAKCTNEENYLIMKFARSVLKTNNIDHCARL